MALRWLYCAVRGAWRVAADAVLIRVFAFLPEGADAKQIRKAVREAYPFGPRKYWPYKVWLARVRRWKLARAMGLTVPPEKAVRRREKRDERQLRLPLDS